MTSATESTRLPWVWRLLAWPLAGAGWLIVRGLAATWRLRVRVGERVEADLLRSEGPVLLCAWHAGLLPAAAWALSPRIRRRLRPTFLVSRSRDGELVTRLLRLWGARVVRGSSSKGGRQALRALHRAMRAGDSVFALPDGPRGPERVFKPGTFVLAQVAGADIVTLASRVSSCWRLRSWDRLRIPKPFARVELALGEPVRPPKELDEQGQADALRDLEQALQALEDALLRS